MNGPAAAQCHQRSLNHPKTQSRRAVDVIPPVTPHNRIAIPIATPASHRQSNLPPPPPTSRDRQGAETPQLLRRTSATHLNIRYPPPQSRGQSPQRWGGLVSRGRIFRYNRQPPKIRPNRYCPPQSRGQSPQRWGAG
ncbi:MAG UNVERIFIED_CONTAM: hypothetical protein LVR18_05910 [Planctomycetaceae bacterium]